MMSEDHSNISVISMFGLLLVLFSSTGAVRLSGSSDYAVPGSPFNLICDVPDVAENVTFYRSPDRVVGSVKVLNASCYYYNETSDIPCGESFCECLPSGDGVGRKFNWTIRPTAQDHSSSWFCVRYNPWRIDETLNSPDYILQIAKSPDGDISLNPPSTNYNKKEGEILPDITCIADCRPGCKFVWTKPDYTNFTSSVLSLSQLNRTEQGTYRCTARNTYGTNSITVMVIVNYGPGESVALSPPTSVYIRNEGVTLPDINCIADCRPSCTFFWTKPDKIIFVASSSSVLSLGQLDRSEHGRYRCNARNEVSNTTREINVTVQYPPHILSLSYDQGNANVKENEAKSMSCAVDSYPSSTITWYFNNITLLTTFDVMESTYILANAGCQDTGIYTCSARNSASNAPYTMDIYINVLCKPRIDTRVNTVFTIGIGLSRDLVLTASYLSNPEPTFTWLFHMAAKTEDLVHGKERVSIRSTYHATDLAAVSTLTRSRMEERWFGIYIVTVTNDQGSDTVVYTVTAADKPNPPVQGKADCPFANRALLSWISDFNGGSEQKFVVGMKGDQEDTYVINTNTKYDDPGRGKRIDAELSDLLPDRLYFFSVIAINEHGNSSLVNEVNCTTKAIPVVEGSNTAGIVVGVVVSILIIAALSIAVVIFRRKMFTYCKKDDDTQMTSPRNGLDPEQLYQNQVVDEAEAIQVSEGNRISTYESLQAHVNPDIYDDLHASPDKQTGPATGEGDPKATKKDLKMSNQYENVKYSESEPTYINAVKKKKHKKKNKS
ncbi:hemicentin-1-like isoform X2 [Mizuhopecten yessoensis]|uniref:hemicentin-1-like isoform X2 n=1 Tax=Mizuhopecten yessoensis TaxID=6573 RepID=UPI000B45B87A|nr:hemicentin-1-like isoform X2 [Mizuhopecten yessoensis]